MHSFINFYKLVQQTSIRCQKEKDICHDVLQQLAEVVKQDKREHIFDKESNHKNIQGIWKLFFDNVGHPKRDKMIDELTIDQEMTLDELVHIRLLMESKLHR